MNRRKKPFRNGFFFPRSAMVFANGNLVPERNYRYRRGLVRRNDTVQWHEPRRPLPGEDAVDGVVDMDDDSKRLGVVQLVFEVYTRAWGVPFNRPFVLVRCLKRAPRTGRGATPYEDCENRAVGHADGALLDDMGTKDKLGVLWTWDPGARGGVFKVLPGSKVLQSVPMMPHFKRNTAEYSMDIGMHENPFTLDARGRPPFWECKCGHGA